MPELDKKKFWRFFFVVAGCIVLYWLLHETERVKNFFQLVSDMIAPFVFGGVLAFILNVPVRAIETKMLKKMSNRVWKRVISVALTLAAVLLVLTMVFWLLIPQVIQTVNSLVPNLSAFFGKAQTNLMDFLGENPQLLEWLKENTDFETVSWASVVERTLGMFGNSISTVLNGAITAISGAFSAVFDCMIGVVFSIYCLFQKETLARQGKKLLYAFTKEKTADAVVRFMRLTNATFSNFLSGQCVEVCILGVLFAISMSIFRMPYVPLISVLIAITAFIPIVGAWVGCIVGTFLIFVQDPMLAVLFVVMFCVLQFIENNMIYPRVVGTSVGLSGMWVLVAVAVGGELMGVIGMFLMIPVASVLYTLLKEVTNNKLKTISVDPGKIQSQQSECEAKVKEKRKAKTKKNKEE